MQKHGKILNTYYYVKEADLKGYILCDSNYSGPFTLWG